MVQWYTAARMRQFFRMLFHKPFLGRRRLSFQLVVNKSTNGQLLSHDAAVQHIRLDQLLSTARASPLKYAVILLNCDSDDVPLNDYFRCLWAGAAIRFIVDGGANVFHKLRESNGDATCRQNERWKPDVVCGDFDSIRPDLLENYQHDPDVQVIRTPDQNATDFVKCLGLLHDRCRAKACHIDYIVALHGGGGRFDHLMGNLDALYQAEKIFKPYDDVLHVPQLVLTSFMPPQPNIDSTHKAADVGMQVQCLLKPGMTWKIHVNSHSVGSKCGLIPLSGATQVHTNGLKWDLVGAGKNLFEALEFGRLVSTSNAIAKETVVVEAQNNPLVWTCNLCVPS